MIAALFAAVAPFLATAAGAVELRYRGVPAIPSDPAGISAMLEVRPLDPRHAAFDLVERDGSRTIRAYDVDMTRKLHMIVVSDDLREFAHVHPVLGPRGHFRINVAVPQPGRYLVYADGEPSGFDHTVFRFTVPFGSAGARRPVVGTPSRLAATGPYRGALDSATLPANTPASLAISVSKDGRPAADLTPYLGSPAHVVFIDAATLAYVHVHPSPGSHAPAMAAGMSMRDMDMAPLPPGTHVSPNFTAAIPPLAPGAYALWIQFRAGGNLHVARFAVAVR